jgi:hypothetical protein
MEQNVHVFKKAWNLSYNQINSVHKNSLFSVSLLHIATYADII